MSGNWIAVIEKILSEPSNAQRDVRLNIKQNQNHIDMLKNVQSMIGKTKEQLEKMNDKANSSAEESNEEIEGISLQEDNL